MLSPDEFFVVYDVSSATVVGADTTKVGISKNAAAATEGGFPLFDAETIYYQWPHFSNADSASERFPLFENLEESCENDDGIYASPTSYFSDVFSFDIDRDTTIT